MKGPCELGALCGGSGAKGIHYKLIFAHTASAVIYVGYTLVWLSLPCRAVEAGDEELLASGL